MNELNSSEWLLIKKSEFIELIEGAREQDVDTTLLDAIYKWLNQHNKIDDYE